MKRNLFGMIVSLAAVGLMVACHQDPTASLREGVARVTINRTYAEIDIGEKLQLEAIAADSQGNILPDLPEVISATEAVATVQIDSFRTNDPLPRVFFSVEAVGFGTTDIIATSGGRADTMTVVTFPTAMTLVGGGDTLRSGVQLQLTPRFEDADGNPYTPVPGAADTLVWATTSASRAGVTQAGLVTAGAVGAATVSAELRQGTAASRDFEIVPGVPAGAALSASSFGAVSAGGTSTLQAVVTDAYGNENNYIGELLSISAITSDPGVASVATAIEDTLAGGTGRQLFVTATGVSGGSADITVVVTTSEGTFDILLVPVTVLAPAITATSPSGAPGASVTINGVGLAATGFLTQVLVDGAPVGNVTSVSATAVTADMPTLLPGTYDLQVAVGGVVSNVDSWTQTSAFDEAATEPNDAIGEEAPITASFEFTGSVDEATDFNDLFQFTVSEDDLVIDVEMSWGDGNDLDFVIYPIGAADPGSYAEDLCGYDGATLANPETATCTLGAAGTYTIEVMHYGTGPTTYTLRGTIQP